MIREPAIKWLFMDLNSYFASVEQQENPSLRGKPVAVIPTKTDYTCVIAASYEAKAYGVKTGMAVKEAKKRCPNLLCVCAHHDLYVSYHHKIINDIINHTPINNICSIDELSSRLPPNKRNIPEATKVANTIRQSLWDNVGTYINCSIGFAPNSLLAKVACDMNKPNGLTFLQQENLPSSLYTLELTDIPGIGSNMKKRLNKFGISGIEEFCNTTPKQARTIWGSVLGERFWYLLHGYDIEQASTKTTTIDHSRVLDPQTRTAENAYVILRSLAMKAAYRLRHKSLHTRSVSISLHLKSGGKMSAETTISATQDPFVMLQHIDSMWGKLLGNITGPGSDFMATPKIKKISISLNKLVARDEITEDFFANSSSLISPQKTLALAKALETLQEKYKKPVVSLGVPPTMASEFTGTKIAFSRIPEKEEFWS